MRFIEEENLYRVFTSSLHPIYHTCIPAFMSEEFNFVDVLNSSHSEVLPSYQPRSNNYLNEKDVKVDNAIISVAEAADTKKALRDAIRDLKDSAYGIELSFREVGKGLHDAAQVSPHFRSDLTTFKNKWDEYREVSGSIMNCGLPYC